MASMLIVAVLSFWIPCASAEISQDLDPMVSPDAQSTVAGESSMDSWDSAQTSDAVSPADATPVEKKIEEPKKEKKSKKSLKKKSEEKKKKKSDGKKKKKSSSKSSKKHKKSSY
jgi:outer membrane biosynthesis protein TonB